MINTQLGIFNPSGYIFRYLPNIFDKLYNEIMAQAKVKEQNTYSRFDILNGEHPMKEAVPESVVLYPARLRKGGTVRVFNFSLAKEMGLIAENHPHIITPELEQKVLETFGIVIINEYDQINGKKFPKEDILEHSYMATRYLQLQHPNKRGKTSGDGRAIWNGQISHNNQCWDVSSSGTGATCLSPATHIENKFFKTGDPTISYGCGYSEIDEGLSTFLFSEVMNQNSISTERILAIIEYPKGMAINVRAHKNLLRPSHFFAPLKLAEYDRLKKLFHYHKKVESKNRNWKPKSGQCPYEYFLERQTDRFAKMAAKFESDYIFCWMDWDGDNILMDAGIIDYGSIRQFGLFHHEYRFDDVERYSTNIKEQKIKARYMVQSFCQMIDYLKTKKKKSIKSFSKHKMLKKFDQVFSECKDHLLLKKVGFTNSQSRYLLTKHRKIFNSFKSHFEYFERAKSLEGIEEVGDGLNWSAIFCMRDILRELPQIYLFNDLEVISPEKFINIIKSSYATNDDLRLTPYRKNKIRGFQRDYLKLVSHTSSDIYQTLTQIAARSSIINRYDRVTGDSVTTIVDKLMKKRPKLTVVEYDEILQDFICYQNLDPDNIIKSHNDRQGHRLIRDISKIVKDYREGL